MYMLQQLLMTLQISTSNNQMVQHTNFLGLIEMTVLQQNKQRKTATWKQAPCVTHILSISRGILLTWATH